MNPPILVGAVARNAWISPDERYRYTLSRIWDPRAGGVLFVMLNPSTADAMQDDATIRRCTGFAKHWCLGGFRVVNLFAWRATDPRELHRLGAESVNIVGPDNLRAIAEAAAAVPRVVVAWGAHALRYPAHTQNVVSLLRVAHKRALYCLGLTAEGAPRHPLRLARSTPMQEFLP